MPIVFEPISTVRGLNYLDQSNMGKHLKQGDHMTENLKV